MTLEVWIVETEAERPERALWPSETNARRFRDCGARVANGSSGPDFG